MIDRGALGLDNEPDHSHPFQVPGMADLLQLARALGGGSYPGLGAGQNDTTPLVDSVAPGFPLNLPFLVPSNQVKQQQVALTFQPQAYRTYYSASQHVHAGDTVASDGTAGSSHAHTGDTVQNLSISIGNESAAHDHGIFNHQHSIGVTGFTGSGDGLYYDVTSGSHIGKALVGPGTLLTDVSGTITPGTAGENAFHGHANTSHTHTSVSNTGGESSHDHSHGHTPGTTGANNPAAGVQEGTSPDGMHVMVDGTDVTTQLGGPFTTAQTELDITPYVGPGTGLHTVQVSTATNLGRIAGFVRQKAIVNNLALL